MRTFPALFALLVVAVASYLYPTETRAELLYTSNGTNISRFDSTSSAVLISVPLQGMQSGETLIGIDVRPFDSALYGVGSTGRMYTINPLTGITTQVGSGPAFTPDGTRFGLDFNPVVDRIRLVSNTEQNLRLNPNDGTLTGTDTPLNPAGNVVAIAYDRNDLNAATPTTLYGIDSASGTLVLIGSINGTPISPNSGAITTVGSLGLGTNLNDNIGFDISGVSGTAFASMTIGGISRICTINLTTGAVTILGAIGSGTQSMSSIAALPEPNTALYLVFVVGLSSSHRFRPARGCRGSIQGSPTSVPQTSKAPIA